MIRDTIAAFLLRVSDVPIFGRNRTRIILGTDRKNTKDSGAGDGGSNDIDSGTIDIVAGFDPSSGDNDLKNDKSRIYVSGKTSPDDYFDIQAGDSVTGEPAAVAISDHIRIKGRKTIKIVNPNFSLVVKDNGDITITSSGKFTVSCPDVALGSTSAAEAPAWSSKILIELQKLQASLESLTPAAGPGVTGAVIVNPYVAPESASAIGATKTKID